MFYFLKVQDEDVAISAHNARYGNGFSKSPSIASLMHLGWEQTLYPKIVLTGVNIGDFNQATTKKFTN